jgi:hypothetical protein
VPWKTLPVIVFGDANNDHPVREGNRLRRTEGAT